MVEAQVEIETVPLNKSVNHRINKYLGQHLDCSFSCILFQKHFSVEQKIRKTPRKIALCMVCFG